MFLRSIAQRSQRTATTTPISRMMMIRPTATAARTRSVWHSGYLDQQQADDLVQAMETVKKELQALKGEQAHAKQEELDNLHQDYKNLTGESYERNTQLHQQELLPKIR
jgi:hypothetical protein